MTRKRAVDGVAKGGSRANISSQGQEGDATHIAAPFAVRPPTSANSHDKGFDHYREPLLQ
jgi:hypothetical protein